MIDLNKMIADSLAKMESSGGFQEIVDKQLEKTMSNIVKDLFGEWSDFSKELKSEVGQKMKINLDRLNLQSYNHLILESIKDKLANEIENEGVAKIKSLIEGLLIDSKTEYKLPELIKQLAKEIEDFDEIGYDERHEMSLHIDDSFGSYWIGMDAREDRGEYECKYRLFVSEEGRIYSVKINDDKYGRGENNDFDVKTVLRGLDGLGETLFKIYASGAKLIIDEDYCELEIYNPEYD